MSSSKPKRTAGQSTVTHGRLSLATQIERACEILGMTYASTTDDTGVLATVIDGVQMTPGSAADYLLAGGFAQAYGASRVNVNPKRLAVQRAALDAKHAGDHTLAQRLVTDDMPHPSQPVRPASTSKGRIMNRRQPTFIDSYDDLPTWVRPGARLLEMNRAGFDTTYDPCTVISITKAQVVCVEGHDPDRDGLAEIRFRRAGLTRIAPGTLNSRNSLVNPHDQNVRDALAVQALTRTYLDIEKLHRDQITQVQRDKRPANVVQATAALEGLASLINAALAGIKNRDAQAGAAERPEGK